MTKTQRQAAIEAIATDWQGATCAACHKVWRIWYVNTRVIARLKCACER